MLLKTKLLVFLIFNFILLGVLYSVPVDSGILENICLIKLITGKECFNCGMTRAFLSVLHFDFDSAYQFNKNVIIVFPFTVLVYLYSWYMFIRKEVNKNE